MRRFFQRERDRDTRATKPAADDVDDTSAADQHVELPQLPDRSEILKRGDFAISIRQYARGRGISPFLAEYEAGRGNFQLPVYRDHNGALFILRSEMEQDLEDRGLLPSDPKRHRIKRGG